MTNVMKDRLISGGIGALASLFVALTVFGLNRNAVKVDFEKEALRKKADVTYVDSRDNEIKSDVQEFKQLQENRHVNEMQQVDRKLDLIIKLIEAKK